MALEVALTGQLHQLLAVKDCKRKWNVQVININRRLATKYKLQGADFIILICVP